MDYYSDFKIILNDLQSANNDVRNQAEEKYQKIEAKLKFEILLNILSNESESYESRYFCCVLCRRLIDNYYKELRESLENQDFESIKSKMLELVVKQSSASKENGLLKKIVEIIIEMGRKDIDENLNFLWNDLVTFVFDTCINAPSDHLKCAGLQIFGAIPNILGDPINVNHVGSLCKLFCNTMSYNNDVGEVVNINVRVAGLKTYSTFIVHHTAGENTLPSEFIAIIPLVLKIIEDSLVADPENDEPMKALVEITDESNLPLKSFAESILKLCLNILQNENTAEKQKNLAIEAFVSLAENCTAVRKHTDIVHALVRELLKLLTRLEDIPDWSYRDNDVEEDDDESDPSVAAEIAMDRLACAMRGRRVLEEITRTVPCMLKSEDWRERHGGLMAISSTAEGLSRVMESMLGAIIQEVSPLLQDSHPRVRYAACNTVGQMCTDFGEKLTKPYHDKIVPSLISILDDQENPRVQAYSGAALVNFLEATEKCIGVHYLPVLADKLYSILVAQIQQLNTTKRRTVIEQFITTVASLADCVTNDFLPVYDQFMDVLKSLLRNCGTEKELRLMKGKTIECISLMGLAVGRDKFLQDGQDVMELLLKSQTEVDANNNDETAEEEGNMSSDDPSVSYMMSAWARICKLLGKEFAPFLPMVMKPLLKTISISPDLCVVYDEEAEDVDQKNWQVVKVTDNKNFAINTNSLEDKAMACQMLVCYAKELTDYFYPYTNEVVEHMINLLQFYLNDEVRSSAAEIMPYLLKSTIQFEYPRAAILFDRIFKKLVDAIDEEPVDQLVSVIMESIGDCIKEVGMQKELTQEYLQSICELVTSKLKLVLENQKENVQTRLSEDYDEDEDGETLEANEEETETLLAQVVHVMHCVLQVYQDDAFAAFQEIASDQLLGQLVQPGSPYYNLEYALCFYSDMIEACSLEKSIQYLDKFAPLFLEGLRHIKPQSRQAAAFGLGVVALKGGNSVPQYNQLLRQLSPILIEGLIVFYQNVDGYNRDSDNNTCVENGISALAKIFKYAPECLPNSEDLSGFLSAWVRWLPVYEDVEETTYVYGLLCDLVESENAVILGPDHNNLPHIIRSIAFCLEKNGLCKTDPTYDRCIRFVKILQQSNNSLFTACVSGMTNDEQMALKKAMDESVISN